MTWKAECSINRVSFSFPLDPIVFEQSCRNFFARLIRDFPMLQIDYWKYSDVSKMLDNYRWGDFDSSRDLIE